ncbi:MAG: DNA primase, partial [Pseudohongiellaceae bacterium]
MAGLIPQRFIDDLLSRVDILDVVDSRVKLRKTGKNYAGLCPFHQEKSPSFTVQPDKQFYYCFGCGAGGNAIGFVMNFENLDFPQAVELLAKDAGLEVPREEGTRNKAENSRYEALLRLLNEVAQWYQQQLRSHPQRQAAVNYLKKRGLSGEIARDYALGYAPPGWNNVLQQFGTDDKLKRLLLDAGMLIENSDNQKNPLYDRFRDRIMYPIRDSRGRVLGFGGRVLGDEKPKYLNSPETEVFRKGEELYGLFEAKRKQRKFERFLLVEGYMDVIALAQHGVHYA